MRATSTAPFDTESDTVAKRPFRRRTKVLIGIGAVIAICGGVIAIDLALSDQDRMVKTFDEPITSLVVDVSGGSVTIVGSNDPTATVEGTVESGLRRPRHRETLEDGRLVIDSHCVLGMLTPSCSIDYVVHVPGDVAVELDADGANADVSGITGRVDVSINGGNVDVTYDVAPPGLKARANGGDIDVFVPDYDRTAYRVKASSNGGSTDVDVRSDPTSDRVIDLHTNGGSISVGYAPHR